MRTEWSDRNKTIQKLHEKYDFAKTQEILGQDMYEGLALLEETKW